MALIKCSECGKEMSNKAKQCPHCGSPIEKKLLCKECGKEINKNDNKCPHCGYVNIYKIRIIVIIVLSILLFILFIIILSNSTKKLQENLWYADENGKWTYKFSNGDLYYHWWSGKTSIIGTYSVNGNTLYIQEDEAFGASYTCKIKSNKKIECNCDKQNDENCQNKIYTVAENENVE